MSKKKLWYKTARAIIKAGQMPFPVSDTLIELLQTLITEEEARFISDVFNRQPNLNINQIKDATDKPEDELEDTLSTLMQKGILTGLPSTSTGVMVYRLMPPFPGIFEFSLMKKSTADTLKRDKKLATLFDTLFKEMSEGTQKNYDNIVPQYKNFPPVDRVIPVEKEIDIEQEVVLPSEEVKKVVDKFDNIAVALCYCRHEKELLGDPCKIDAPRENCLTFGKTARFSIQQGFAKPISKKEAKDLLNEAEEHGLVHRAFHIHQNPERDEEAICSCCKCCCGIFQLFYRGVMPIHTTTSYLAKLNEDNCIGCGTCTRMCAMEAVTLEDDVAVVNKNRCIGCGVCAYHCPEEAMILDRTGQRNVFVPPPKVEQT
ncbi:MAG: 4Fe-4S binding protein [Promethearchaeia archaeon]